MNKNCVVTVQKYNFNEFFNDRMILQLVSLHL